MALLADWTGSFEATPAYSEFLTYSGGTTCTPPITTNHTLAQLIARDSTVKRHGSFSGKVLLRVGDHINNVCTKDGVQLYGPPRDIINGSEQWYSFSWRIPTGGIVSSSFNTMHEFGVANGATHPQYLVNSIQCLGSSAARNLTLQIQAGHKAGPGGSDFNPTAPGGYKAAEVLLGPTAPRPLTLDKWHDFYMHIVWSAYHGLTLGQIVAPGAHTIVTGVLEIWHREEGGVFEKLYSNLNNGTALINRAPHPTLNWNDQYGAPGENGTQGGTMHMGFYRDAQSITDTYWVDTWLRRQNEAQILGEFGATGSLVWGSGTWGTDIWTASGTPPTVPSPPDPAAGRVRVGNAQPAGGFISTADPNFKRVIKRGVGAGNTVAFQQGYGYMQGPPSGGAALLRMVVYDDDAAGGAPGTFKGMSDEVSLPVGAALSWVSFPFSTPATVTGDQVYIGFISGGAGVSSYGYQSVVGQGLRLADTYSDGPANPFGASPLTMDIEPGFVLDYTTAGDTRAPVFVSAQVTSTSLLLSYDEALDSVSIPSSTAFTVTVNQSSWPLQGSVNVAGATVEVLLLNAVLAGDIVTVSYTAPGASPLQDVTGNDVANLASTFVQNQTTPIGVRIVSPASRVAIARRVDPSDRRPGVGGGL